MAGGATRIEADLEQPILAAVGTRLAGVCRLPSDPIIKHLTPYGSVSWRYPGTVVILDEAGTLEVAGPVPGSGGVACADHGRVWLLRFDQETHGDPAPQAREVLPGEGRVTGPLDMLQTDDGEVWFGDPGASVLTVAAPRISSLRELRIGLDCRPWIPQPQLPPGFDADRFEQSWLDQLHGSSLDGWQTEDGDVKPFIEGVSFDTVELRGNFPDRRIVVLFHAQDRPGIQFGRCWRLYDELGNPVEFEYADIGLMEDIEAVGSGLPAPGSCVPDSDGVVWFQ